MRILLPSARRRARIEIIPLIDVIFFLLATFMMVSLSKVKNQGIPIHLPTAGTAASQEQKRFTAITVTEGGELYLDKEKISLEELPKRLGALKATEQNPQVVIHGDEKAFFGNAISVLDQVRKMGITKVTIRTKPLSKSESRS